MSLAQPLPDPGGKIAMPGIYDLSMARYHSDTCIGPSVSNSGLKTLWDDSPAHYWANSYLNPRRLEEVEDRPHFSIGRAAHHLLFLGRKGFEEEFAVRPEEFSDWRTKKAKLWREAALADGKTLITDGELEAIAGMARSLSENMLVQAGILDGYVERSLIWQHNTGVWLKSRPDCIPNDSGDFADLKTCASVRTDDLRRALGAFNYPMQAALIPDAGRPHRHGVGSPAAAPAPDLQSGLRGEGAAVLCAGDHDQARRHRAGRPTGRRRRPHLRRMLGEPALARSRRRSAGRRVPRLPRLVAHVDRQPPRPL